MTESLLLPSFRRSEVIGIVAGIRNDLCRPAGFDRDAQAEVKQRHESEMAAIMGVFQIVWVYYGLLIVSRPVIVWNIVAVLINSLMVGAFFYFARNEKMGRREA